MANSPQAIKRARQNVKRRIHNNAIRSDMRTQIRKILSLVKSNSDKDAITACYKSMCSKVDRLARKGMIATNRAARLKSRINKRIKG